MFWFAPCPTLTDTVASLYQRARSPFWWIEHVDAAGARRQESTKLRYAVASESRKAHQLRDELTARERAQSSGGGTSKEAWERWVPRFLEQRYGGSPLTHQRALAAWRNLEAFLRAHEVVVPRQLTRQQIRDFIGWRSISQPEAGTHKAAKNTALLEIKFLGIIMHEALESGFCAHNPCLKLGISRDQAKRKPKITPKEHLLITRALKGEPEWMRISYEIAWEQGCRFSETCLPTSDVDLARNTIRFRTKGRKESVTEFPLSPRLRPLFERLRREKRKATFEMPAMPGKAWWFFFRRIGMAHLCFHCTRVSFISRCYENGIPREMVMRLAGHTSTAAHEIYPRLESSGDLLQEMRKLM